MRYPLTADTLLVNAQLWSSAQPAGSDADSIALQGGRIMAMGTHAEMKALSGAGSTVLDLEGRMLLPGFCDSHIHLQEYARSHDVVHCETDTIDIALKRIAARAEELEPGEWLLGHGWRMDQWGRFGTIAELDAVCQGHPTYITSKSLHAAWVNTKAFEAAGVTNTVNDPPGGTFNRDEHGNLTGIILENALLEVSGAIPAPKTERLAAILDHAQKHLHAYGITSVHDFDRTDCLRALQHLRAEGKLALRVLKQIRNLEVEPYIEAGLYSGFGDDWIRLGQVKFFADGAIGPHTAHMLHAYEGTVSDVGIPTMDPDELYELVRHCVDNRLAVSIHAIGDAANRMVLSLYERLASEGHPRLPLPHRIEHLQLIHPDDISRIRRDDLIISMQPYHAVSDMFIAQEHWGERCENAYAWRSVIDTGATVIFGSDAPVETPSPLIGIHAAVTRRRATGEPGPEGWYPAQRITREEALAAYTSTPPSAAGVDSTQGKILPGFMADLQVYDADLLTCEVDELLEIQPCGVMVDGEWVIRTF